MRSDYPLLPFDRNRYPVPHLRVEVVALTVEDGRTKVLMRQWRDDPYAGQLILPGGFVRAMASLEDCARDIFTSMGGPEVVKLHQFGVFSAPDRDPRGWVVSVGVFVLVPFEAMTEAIANLRDLSLVEVSYDESVRLSTLTIGRYRVWAGFDHEDIIVAALQHVRARWKCLRTHSIFCRRTSHCSNCSKSMRRCSARASIGLHSASACWRGPLLTALTSHPQASRHGQTAGPPGCTGWRRTTFERRYSVTTTLLRVVMKSSSSSLTRNRVTKRNLDKEQAICR